MAKSFNQCLKTCLIFLIRCYQYTISAFLGNCCRFQPSCSAYTIQAIQHFGCIRGFYLALKRILCCHPWHPGGIDPLPKTHTIKTAPLNRASICKKIF
ncbi:MAG: membrane protein insertion efficiency factor YidD [Gammaproteobacteria bacterium]|nr:membrane protein insertion efficiency factor YidD [Gammaproteobacteria bacterium]